MCLEAPALVAVALQCGVWHLQTSVEGQRGIRGTAHACARWRTGGRRQMPVGGAAGRPLRLFPASILHPPAARRPPPPRAARPNPPAPAPPASGQPAWAKTTKRAATRPQAKPRPALPTRRPPAAAKPRARSPSTSATSSYAQPPAPLPSPVFSPPSPAPARAAHAPAKRSAKSTPRRRRRWPRSATASSSTTWRAATPRTRRDKVRAPALYADLGRSVARRGPSASPAPPGSRSPVPRRRLPRLEEQGQPGPQVRRGGICPRAEHHEQPQDWRGQDGLWLSHRHGAFPLACPDAPGAAR